VRGATAAVYDRLKGALAAGQPVAVATVVRGPGTGRKLLIAPDGTVGGLGDAELDAAAGALADELLAAERSETRVVRTAGGEAVELYVETHPIPPTLLIFGAVHVAQALCRLAKLLGFRVIVTDARAALATEERFPDADRIVRAWPDDALAEIEVTASTYVAILTHDPKFDEPALLGTLGTPARYIGAVGSRKTNRDRRERLVAAGVAPEKLARVRGPIGLNIGAETPEETAVSILAEVIAVRHGRPGGRR
jgi:xanthine dehydrogenase accessory factor